jgi:hypothetical protein
MTVTLKIKNHGGPYTVEVNRHRMDDPTKIEHMGILCPGEEDNFTIWNDNYLVINELPIEYKNEKV